MELEKHVLSAIDDYAMKKPDSSLMHACNAIEGTARNLFSINTATNKHYKDCIRSYYWIIEPMIGAGLNLEETKWNNLSIYNGKGKIINNPDLADVIYHIFRCNHDHCKPVPDNFKILPVEDGYSYWKLGNGELQMPERIIWALLAVSVFSKANAGIKTTGEYYLTYGSKMQDITVFPIKDWWGREEDFRTFINSQKIIRVKIENLGNMAK